MGATYTRQSTFTDGDVIDSDLFNNEFDQLLAAFASSTGHTHDGTAGEGGPVTALVTDGITFGTNTGDITLTWNGGSADGVIIWKEDEDYFEFSDDLLIAADEKIQFRDTAIYINSSADGQLDLVADTEIQIAATTIDINGNVDVSGTLTVAGAVDFGDAALSNVGAVQLDSISGDGDTNTSITFSGSDVITVANAGTNQVTFNDGSIAPVTDSDVDLGTNSLRFKDAYIDSATVTGEVAAASLDISGNVDIDGTLETDALSINSTTVTSTAAELNILDGVTASAADINLIDGITNGTVIASKAIVTDANIDITGGRNITISGELDAATLDISGNADIDGTLETDALSINGTAVTSTAAELNILDGVTSTAAELNILDGVTASAADINLIDGVTNGTVIASKAIITDANKDITGGRNITISGELDAATLDISGDADIDGTLEADAITVNGTALATVIAGTTVTNATNSAHVLVTDNESTNEENLIAFVEGATSSTGNVGLEMDGNFAYNPSSGTVSATIFKGNIDAVDGDFDGTLEADALSLNGTTVTSTAAELNILDGVTSTAAELNILDGVTSTAAELNILDGVTSTAAELNILDGVTATAAELNILDVDNTTLGDLAEISTVANDDVFLAIDTSGGGLKKLTRSTIVSGLATSSGLSNVVEDTTPQLGGNLDTNSHNILIDDAHFIADESGNEQLVFQTTGSAVNQFEMTNSASGYGPQLAATGGDTNIDLNLLAKATGHVTVLGNSNSGAIQFNCENNSHGQIVIAQPHSAGVTNTMLLPAGANSTLVSLVSTDTLTNKTLTSPKINEDVAVTSTATELNLLDGVTSTTAELNILDGVTATAAELNALDGITAVVGELNALDIGSTAVGTAVASKAVILDSNKDYTGMRNFTITGDLVVGGTTTVVDTVTMNAENAVVFEGATADGNETTLTIVDPDADRTIKLPNQSGTIPVLAAESATAITSTPEELNILDGVTSTAAELNALDGITAVVGELNALDIGSTAVGTAVASKAVILDSNKDYTGMRNLTISGELDAGSLDISGNADIDGTLETDALSINGTAVTSTAAELNILDGVTTTAAEINLIDGGTARGTTAVADGDGILINDAGTMRMTNVQTVSAYMAAESVGGGNIVTTGALNSGTITSGFGAIDNGSSNITTTGVGSFGSLDISGAIDVDGTTNLDVVDIDGAVNMATTALVTGVLTTTAATVFNGGFASNDGSTITTNDNSYTLQLISTDADANQGPLLSLHRQSGSPADNDTIGSIQYRFNNDADQPITGHLAIAQIVDASDGTEDCHIIEQLMVAGTMEETVRYTPTETVFNEDSKDRDFRVESNNLTSALFVNGADGVVTAGAAFTATGKITADAGIDIDNFNIDGTTIALSSGDMTLDAAGDIILDADGGDIHLEDGAVRFGSITKDGDDFKFNCPVADGDIKFVGNDNGVGAVTALRLDMSAAGAAIFNNDVTAFSDERLKSNITTIPDALSKVTEMRGVHYVRDATGKNSSGVIAQELQKIAPELVLTAEDEMGTLSVNYGNITGYLIEAVKELSARVKELEGK